MTLLGFYPALSGSVRLSWDSVRLCPALSGSPGILSGSVQTPGDIPNLKNSWSSKSKLPNSNSRSRSKLQETFQTLPGDPNSSKLPKPGDMPDRRPEAVPARRAGVKPSSLLQHSPRNPPGFSIIPMTSLETLFNPLTMLDKAPFKP
jgi:hypothetical protein